MFEDRNCEHCSNTFAASLKEIKRGGARFCSLSCSSKSASLARSAKNLPNVTCYTCSKPFYKSKKKLEQASKGYHFCTNACRVKVQRIGGLEAILPAHYGTAAPDYRAIAFEAYPPECDDCGWNLVDSVLQVHHRDCNHNNNAVDNLQILCANCHDLTHFVTRTGKYRCKEVTR